MDGVFNEAELSTLNYQIDHTERTWGDDLETIISSQINDVIRGRQSKDTWFNAARIILAILIVIGFIVLPIYAITQESVKNGSDALAGYMSLGAIDNKSIDIVIKKLDYIAEYQFSGLSKRVSFWFLSIYAGFPVACFFS